MANFSIITPLALLGGQGVGVLKPLGGGHPLALELFLRCSVAGARFVRERGRRPGPTEPRLTTQMGLYTGTRHSAMTALLWHESATQAWVDLDAGMIYRRGKAEKESKTKRRPVVRIPPRLLAHMRRWKRIDERRAAEEAKRRHNQPPEEAQAPSFITVLHHGGHPLAGKIRTGFEGCVRDAGLDPAVTPHWMRHTAATWLMQNRCDLWEAAGFLGMTVAVLEKHYGHHHPDHQSDAVQAITRKRS